MTTNALASDRGLDEFDEEEIQDLRDLVERRRICWMLWPEMFVDPVAHRRLQVGFEVDLAGTHDHPEDPPAPGSRECVKLWLDLQRIARWIVPEPGEANFYEIAHYTPAVSYWPQRQFRADVTLSIKILHRGRFDQPIDEPQAQLLHRIEHRLKALGVRRDSWSA
jgi:hypothetical protein